MSTKPIVLITGVTGYIAGWVAKYFLDAGYSVRGTTRSKSSAQPLIDALVSKGYSAFDIEIYEVADITIPGAFDEAVKDVEVVAHLATPVSLSFTDPEPVIRTAVEGALVALKSTQEHGNNVKTFIQMSSIAAVLELKNPPPYVFSEKDWNESSYATVKELGKNTPGAVIYLASKAESEKAVWKWRDEAKPKFDVVAINPGWVSGPPLVLPKTADKVGETFLTIYNIFAGNLVPGELGAFPTYIHVYDVARLFVWAAQNSETANGERYLAVAGQGSEQAIADILREAYPEKRDSIPAGTPGSGYTKDFAFNAAAYGVDASKGVKATGQEWIKYGDVVRDTAKALEHLV